MACFRRRMPICGASTKQASKVHREEPCLLEPHSRDVEWLHRTLASRTKSALPAPETRTGGSMAMSENTCPTSK